LAADGDRPPCFRNFRKASSFKGTRFFCFCHSDSAFMVCSQIMDS
jgi:hypothetical protein